MPNIKRGLEDFYNKFGKLRKKQRNLPFDSKAFEEKLDIYLKDNPELGFYLNSIKSSNNNTSNKLMYYLKLTIIHVISEIKYNNYLETNASVHSDLIKYLEKNTQKKFKNDIKYVALEKCALSLFMNVETIKENIITLENIEVRDGIIGINPAENNDSFRITGVGEENATKFTIDGIKYTVIKFITKSNSSIYECKDQDGAIFILKLNKERSFDETNLKSILTPNSINENNALRLFDENKCGYYVDKTGLYSFAILKKQEITLSEKIKVIKNNAKEHNELLLGNSITKIFAFVKILHDASYAHRDIKTENLMYNESGEIVAIDFGSTCEEQLIALKKEHQEELEKIGIYTDDDNRGSPGYVHNEDLEEGSLDRKSDMYSIGCVLFEMYTGERLIDFLDTLPNKSTYPSTSDHYKAIQAKLAKVSKEFGFYYNPLKPNQENLPNLIMNLLSEDKEKRFDINQAIKVYNLWKKGLSRSESSESSELSKIAIGTQGEDQITIEVLSELSTGSLLVTDKYLSSDDVIITFGKGNEGKGTTIISKEKNDLKLNFYNIRTIGKIGMYFGEKELDHKELLNEAEVMKLNNLLNGASIGKLKKINSEKVEIGVIATYSTLDGKRYNVIEEKQENGFPSIVAIQQIGENGEVVGEGIIPNQGSMHYPKDKGKGGKRDIKITVYNLQQDQKNPVSSYYIPIEGSPNIMAKISFSFGKDPHIDYIGADGKNISIDGVSNKQELESAITNFRSTCSLSVLRIDKGKGINQDATSKTISSLKIPESYVFRPSTSPRDPSASSRRSSRDSDSFLS